MILVSFFGLFRAGEVSLSNTGLNNVLHKEGLQLNHDGGKVSSVTIKTRAFKHSAGRAATIPLCRQQPQVICPVRALVKYLSKSTGHQGPLFHHPDGTPVTTVEFRSILRKSVKAAHLECNKYTCHSLRIGGATHAHLSNMPHSQIRQLGRWRSNAYKKYIRVKPLAV
jgi:hypothetical protein